MTTFEVSSAPHGAWRPMVAALLRAGSLALAGLARRLEEHARRGRRLGEEPPERMLEFQADGGSSGGTLFVDGTRVARLPVDRL